LLVLPPGELLIVAGLVIGRRNVVKPGSVESVAIDLDERPVVLEVGRDISMPLHIAPIDLVALLAGRNHVGTNRLYVLGFTAVHRNRFNEGFLQGPDQIRAGRYRSDGSQ